MRQGWRDFYVDRYVVQAKQIHLICVDVYVVDDHGQLITSRHARKLMKHIRHAVFSPQRNTKKKGVEVNKHLLFLPESSDISENTRTVKT